MPSIQLLNEKEKEKHYDFFYETKCVTIHFCDDIKIIICDDKYLVIYKCCNEILFS